MLDLAITPDDVQVMATTTENVWQDLARFFEKCLRIEGLTKKLNRIWGVETQIRDLWIAGKQ